MGESHLEPSRDPLARIKKSDESCAGQSSNPLVRINNTGELSVGPSRDPLARIKESDESRAGQSSNPLAGTNKTGELCVEPSSDPLAGIKKPGDKSCLRQLSVRLTRLKESDLLRLKLSSDPPVRTKKSIDPELDRLLTSVSNCDVCGQRFGSPQLTQVHKMAAHKNKGNLEAHYSIIVSYC